MQCIAAIMGGVETEEIGCKTEAEERYKFMASMVLRRRCIAHNRRLRLYGGRCPVYSLSCAVGRAQILHREHHRALHRIDSGAGGSTAAGSVSCVWHGLPARAGRRCMQTQHRSGPW